nr:IS5 family transposase [Reyranella sp. CPCC 100927]
MVRRELTDRQWSLIASLVPGKKGDRGASGRDNRLFVDAVLWIVRSGAPWRDLPPLFGPWNSVYQRFNRWCRSGVWYHLFKALIHAPDFSYRIIDSTIVRAHQHAAGAKRGPQNQALGRSRGGLSTKVNLAVDASGRPLRLLLAPGQRHDIRAARQLIVDQRGGYVLADRAYDAQWFIELIHTQGATPVIPARTCSPPRQYDRQIYRDRNLVERCINKLKHFRRLATRYEKTARNYLGVVTIAAMTLWWR